MRKHTCHHFGSERCEPLGENRHEITLKSKCEKMFCIVVNSVPMKQYETSTEPIFPESILSILFHSHCKTKFQSDHITMVLYPAIPYSFTPTTVCANRVLYIFKPTHRHTNYNDLKEQYRSIFVWRLTKQTPRLKSRQSNQP